MSRLRMHVSSSKNSEIYCEIRPAAAECSSRGLVTLVNGHARTSKDFHSMSRFLCERGFDVLLLDNRGSGQTRYQGPFTIADLADDVEACWRANGAHDTHLLGISMGGIIAQILASRGLREVKSLCLVSTISSAGYYRPSGDWPVTLEGVELHLSRYFDQGFVNRNKLLARAMAKQILEKIADGTFLADSKSQREAMAEFAFDHELAAIDVPTLVVHGANDGVVDVGSVGRFTDEIRGVRVEIYEDTGHLILAERPQRLYQDYYGFLEQFG